MSMNWLEGMNDHADGSGQPHPMAMPAFAGQKLVVVGGSSGMGRQTAADVVAAAGSAVIIGQDPGKIDDTVQTLAKDGPAYGIAADLADRMQAEQVCQQLADEHTDATLLTFPVGYGADARAVAGLTGAFANPEPVYLQSTGFVLDPAGKVVVSVYSSGAIGRLVPEDVAGLVRYVRGHAATSA
jgi:short chain dehydrogenase